ncbi:acetylxylan esterase, partial [Promicromonospora sp. NPDC059942]|uniref:acetylxylan esterase n=1 Tax=Promicromonospora sp. NPDC059942 TaxID=3347009 RepID=UPI00364B4985
LTDCRERDGTRNDFTPPTLRDGEVSTFPPPPPTPAWFSCGLDDDITPPETVFAAHNEYAAQHDITVWPANGHDAGGSLDRLGALDVLGRLLGTTAGPVNPNRTHPVP